MGHVSCGTRLYLCLCVRSVSAVTSQCLHGVLPPPHTCGALGGTFVLFVLTGGQTGGTGGRVHPSGDASA